MFSFNLILRNNFNMNNQNILIISGAFNISLILYNNEFYNSLYLCQSSESLHNEYINLSYSI